MKKQYIITWKTSNGAVCCATAYKAESEEQAVAYFNENNTHGKKFIGVREDSTDYERRGMTVINVPEGWEPEPGEMLGKVAEDTEVKREAVTEADKHRAIMDGVPVSSLHLREYDIVRVHLFDTNGEEIITDAAGRLFRVERVGGSLGIYWKDNEFHPFNHFAFSVVFERLPIPKTDDDSERRKLSFITEVEDCNPCGHGNRIMYHVGNNFIVELTKSETDPGRRGDLMTTWKKRGFIFEILPTFWSVNTYFTDVNGNCYGWYNIQVTEEHRINFDAVMEATEENAAHLIAACIDMYERGIKFSNNAA